MYVIYSQRLWGVKMDIAFIVSLILLGVVFIIGIICLIYASKYGIKYKDIKSFTGDVLSVVKITNDLKNFIKEQCIKAETMYDNGEDKHNYVKYCVYNFMKDTDYTIDEDTIDKLIEEFITPTKQINYKGTMENGTGTTNEPTTATTTDTTNTGNE